MPGSNRATVMVVDDDPEIVDVISGFLRPTYDVRQAQAGRTAINMMDDSVDVILLDRNMPGMTGDRFLQEIRDDGYECPVGLVTAVYPDFDIWGLSFDDYILKPVDRDELRSTVEALLERQTMSEKAREYLSIQAKMNALEAVKEPYELEASEEYAGLRNRLAALEPLARPDLDDSSCTA